jgi:ribokinase
MKGRILVLGSSNVDLILRIPRFHHPGETIAGENLVTAFGGKGANQAIAARRLGGEVVFLTKLGGDSFGASYRKYLTQEGLPARFLLRDSSLPTGVALIELIPKGENRIIVSPGANGALSVKDLVRHREIWKGVSVFVAQLEIPLNTVAKGLKLAREKGASRFSTRLRPFPFPRECTPWLTSWSPTREKLNYSPGSRCEGRKIFRKWPGGCLPGEQGMW